MSASPSTSTPESPSARTWSADGRRWTLEPHPDSAEIEVVVDDRVELRCSKSALDLLARQALAQVRGRPLNAGKRWSETHDEDLKAAFEEEIPVSDLARQFGRSTHSIRARLAHLGLIEDDGSYRRYAPRPSEPAQNA